MPSKKKKEKKEKMGETTPRRDSQGWAKSRTTKTSPHHSNKHRTKPDRLLFTKMNKQLLTKSTLVSFIVSANRAGSKPCLQSIFRQAWLGGLTRVTARCYSLCAHKNAKTRERDDIKTRKLLTKGALKTQQLSTRRCTRQLLEK